MKALKSMTGAAVALALGLGATAAQAAIMDVTEMSITGGMFTMNAPPGPTNPPNMISAGDEAPIILGTYQGSPTDTAAGSLATFQFGFFGPVGAHTAGDLTGVNGGAAENPAPITATVDTDAGTISVDMGSWFAFWNGTTFNQGNHDVTGSFDVATGEYDISWTSLISGGPPFGGQTGYWQLEGVATVSAVPIPAAAWLFGTAVVGFAGLARRSKAKA